MKYNAYYNGFFGKAEDIRIPICDRAIFFGDGIYDAAIGRNGKIFLLEEHIQRFISNARALDLPLPLPENEIRELLQAMAKEADKSGFFIYFQLTRFSTLRTHSYPDTEKSNLLITTTPLIPPAKSKSIKLISAPDVRYKLCHIKTLNLLPAVLASKAAERLSADETVFYRDGIVTECAHSNIHIVRSGTVITHPTDCNILPGISRRHLLRCCEAAGIPFSERPFTLAELKSADEVIVTSSSKISLTAEKVDDICFTGKPGGIGEYLMDKMRDDFLGETE